MHSNEFPRHRWLSFIRLFFFNRRILKAEFNHLKFILHNVRINRIKNQMYFTHPFAQVAVDLSYFGAVRCPLWTHACLCTFCGVMCACKCVLFTEDWKSPLCNINRSHTLFHTHPCHSHAACLSVSLSLSLFPSPSLRPSLPPSLSFFLSFLWAKFHTTCPRQSRFTDYHPLHAKPITQTHVDGDVRTHTSTLPHTVPSMQCNTGRSGVSSSCWLSLFVRGTWLREQVRQAAGRKQS